MTPTHTDGGPAFPRPGYDGMTLRDHFAIKMAAAIANGPISNGDGLVYQDAASSAYAFADAMLAQRAKGEAS